MTQVVARILNWMVDAVQVVWAVLAGLLLATFAVSLLVGLAIPDESTARPETTEMGKMGEFVLYEDGSWRQGAVSGCLPGALCDDGSR